MKKLCLLSDLCGSQLFQKSSFLFVFVLFVFNVQYYGRSALSSVVLLVNEIKLLNKGQVSEAVNDRKYASN